MMPVLLRFAALALVLVAAWWLVAWWERRRRSAAHPVAPGVTLIVTPTCLICPEAVTALSDADPTLAVRVLDASTDDVAAYEARSAPTLVVADRHGTIQLRRTGRSVVLDAPLIAATARALDVAA